MKKYEGLKDKIDELLGDFASRDLDKALTVDGFSELIGVNVVGQWESSINWEENEHGTQDFTLSVDTKSNGGEDITIMMVLEVKDNLITHIVNVGEYYF